MVQEPNNKDSTQDDDKLESAAGAESEPADDATIDLGSDTETGDDKDPNRMVGGPDRQIEPGAEAPPGKRSATPSESLTEAEERFATTEFAADDEPSGSDSQDVPETGLNREATNDIQATTDVQKPEGTAESSVSGISGMSSMDQTGSDEQTGKTAPAAADITMDVELETPKTVRGGRTVDGTDQMGVYEDRLLVNWSSIDRTHVGNLQTIRGNEFGTPKRRTNLVIQARNLTGYVEGSDEIADYELLERLGKGGMGVVYAARQASIDRRVAIKKMLPQVANQPVQREKFLTEAVVTGELDHPNIVPIYDLGLDNEGALFYSMKCVQGTPWCDVIEQKSLAENLEILMKSADAVAFANSRGVVHRDLKPENTMLGDFGEVLVMDWGLAIPIGNKSKRSLGGTPAYMAPEMAVGPSEQITAASDIYLMGAILFEILTNHPPHTGDDIFECLAAAARNEIVPTEVSGELMDIALRAMAIDPQDRQKSILEFQEEIRAYQDHAESHMLADRAEQLLADAEGAGGYQQFAHALFGYEEALRLWDGNDNARRGIIVAKSAYATAALTNGDFDFGLSLLDEECVDHSALRDQLTAGRRERDARKRRLRRSLQAIGGLIMMLLVAVSGGLYFVNMQKGIAEHNAWLAVQSETRAEKNARQARDAEKEANQNAQLAVKSEKRAEQNARQARIAEAAAKRSEELARAQEQRAKVAQLFAEKQQQKAETARDRERREAYVARIGLAAAKIDENAFGQARAILESCPADLRSWEWGRLQRLANQSLREVGVDSPLESVAFCPVNRRVAVGGWNGVCQILSFDLESGELQLERALDIEGGFVNDLVFSPDGRRLFTAGSVSAGLLVAWDVSSGKKIAELKGHIDSVTSVSISSDGRWLLTSSLDHSVRIWDTSTYKLIKTLVGHTWWVWDAEFLPGEQTAVSVGQDGAAIIWDLEQGEQTAIFQEHRRPIYALAVDGSGLIASGDSGGRIFLWRLDDVQTLDLASRFTADRNSPVTPFVELDGHANAVRGLSFSVRRAIGDDRLRLVSAGDDNMLRVFDISDRPHLWKEVRGHGGRVRGCFVFSEGGQLLSVSHDETLRLWNLDGYQEQRVFQRLAGHDDEVLAATFGPNQSVFSASRDRTVAGWDLATGELRRQLKEGHSFLATRAVIFAHGTRLITAAGDQTVRGWDIATSSEQFQLENTGIGAALAVSTDEVWLVTGGTGHTIQVWRLDDAEPQHAGLLKGHKGNVTAVSFSEDGRWLVSGDDRGLVLVWDWSTRSIITKVIKHTSRINTVECLPGGSFATASNDHTAALWSLPDAAEVAVFGHPQAVADLAWNAVNSELITVAEDGRLRVWRPDSREPIVVSDYLSDDLSSVAVSADGHHVAVVDYQQNKVTILNRSRLADLTARGILDVAAQGGAVWAAVFIDGRRLVTVGGDDARAWDIDTGKIAMAYGPQGVVSSVDVTADGRYLVSANWERTAKVWDLSTNQVVQTLGYENAGELGAHQGNIYAAKFSRLGEEIATASSDGTVRIWARETGLVTRVIRAHVGPVWALAYSADGQWLASGGADGRVAVWKVEDGSLELDHLAHENGVRAVVFSADTTQLATAGEDRAARTWLFAAGQPLQLAKEILGHSAPVVGVDFHPEEQRLVTAGEDGIAKIWNIAIAESDGEQDAMESTTAQELLSLTGHRGGVTSVQFSPTGDAVLTSSRDGQLILWQTTSWK
jgi:WD40 repeat protein